MVRTNMGSRQKIIHTAEELFHRYGVLNTSVDRILSGANVTKSNFYYHFKSKDKLALTVLKKMIEDFESDLLRNTLANPQLTPLERLESFYERIVSYHESLNCEKGCPFGNMAIELSDIKEEFRQILEHFFKKWGEHIEMCLRDGVEKGQFREEIDPKVLSEIVLSHLEGAIMMVKNSKSILPLKHGTEGLIKLISKE